MDASETETLRQFFGGYFNQDWDYDAPAYEAVVDRYIANLGDDPERLASMAGLLGKLSDTYATDAELEAVLDRDLWCDGFVPSLVGLSARAWVRDIANRLAVGGTKGQ